MPTGITTYPSEPVSAPLIKKEYVVAGAAVGLLAYLLLRKRRNR